MSALNNILSRVRIHGGDGGVSARATHHSVQGFISAQAELRTVRGSTTERKKMSTKTSLKRIALVAIAAVGMGVLSSVSPASAAIADQGKIRPTQGSSLSATSTAATVTGLLGGQVKFAYYAESTADVIITSDANGAVTAGSATGGTVAKVNGTTFADGASWTGQAATDTATITVTGAKAGDNVVSVSKIDSVTGNRTLVAKITITWTSAAVNDLGTVSAYFIANGSCATSIAASTYAAALKTVNNTTIELCVVYKNASGNAYTRDAVAISVVGNGVGTVAGNAVASTSSDSDGYQAYAYAGNDLAGKATFDVTVTGTNADGTTATKTTSASLISYGDFTSITLGNKKAAIGTSASSAATHAIKYSAKDGKGNVTALNLGSASSVTYYVESDKGTSAVTSSVPNNSSATISHILAETVTASTGESAGTGILGVNSGSAYEKLTIWVTAKNAAGTLITSNKVTVYVSSTTVKSLEISAAGSSAGASQKVKVVAYSDPATTKTAYPVVDGEAITLSASIGTLSATSLTTDETGAAEVTFYAPQLNGSVIFTATAEGATVTGTKTVSLSGDALTTLINSLMKRISDLSALVAKIQKKLGVK